jgi:hypothetical protein
MFEVISAIPEVEFHVVTTKIGISGEQINLPKNLKIFRVGNGNFFDKFKLINEGYSVGEKLFKENDYAFVWSVMATYGSLPAYFLKNKKHVPLLVTLGNQNIPSKFSPKYWLLKMLISGSDQVSTNSVVEDSVSRGTNMNWLNSLNKKGDTFSNAFRFVYNMKFKDLYK